MLKIYLILLIVGSFIGWVFEHVARGVTSCETVSRVVLGECMPFTLMYGAGFAILYFIGTHCPSLNIYGKTVLAAVVLTVMECLTGQVLARIETPTPWKYKQSWFPACSGYISIVVSLVWLLVSYLFFAFLFEPLTNLDAHLEGTCE